MFSLVIVLVSGIAVAIFATQNTQTVLVSFFNYQSFVVPVYIIVLVSMLIGIFISWLLSMVGSISSYFTLREKNKLLGETKYESTNLVKRVHQLELENERLKTELNVSGDGKSL